MPSTKSFEGLPASENCDELIINLYDLVEGYTRGTANHALLHVLGLIGGDADDPDELVMIPQDLRPVRQT